MAANPASRSVAFDRAPDYYDRTRALSVEAMASTVELLAGELRGRGPVLEIGVGTGRIALPLARAGVSLCGLDLSRPMMAKLVEKAGGHNPFPLVEGDAAVLPFSGDSFGAGLCVHVFHLIPEWRKAAGELLRVIRPGGTLLVDQGGGWADRNIWGSIQSKFAEIAGIDTLFPGSFESEDLVGFFGARDITMRALPPIEDRQVQRASDLLESLAEGLFSFTWPLEEGLRRRAAAATQSWAERELGPLEAEHELTRTIRWQAYDLPN